MFHFTGINYRARRYDLRQPSGRAKSLLLNYPVPPSAGRGPSGDTVSHQIFLYALIKTFQLGSETLRVIR